jgi:hypothetical protein
MNEKPKKKKQSFCIQKNIVSPRSSFHGVNEGKGIHEGHQTVGNNRFHRIGYNTILLDIMIANKI